MGEKKGAGHNRNELVLETISTPAGVDIAPDEDNEAEINRREFLEGWQAEEAAREAAEAAEANDDDEDDSGSSSSAAQRYLRKSLAAAQ
jgi:hypothetical protein